MNEKKSLRAKGIINNKSICKIIILYKSYLGFLMEYSKKEKNFFCLITSEDNIKKDMISKKEKIKFYYDKGSKSKEIYLNPNERLIKSFKDININVIAIEILPRDKIDEKYFLLPFIDNRNDLNKLINGDIIIISYIKDKLKYSNGKIIKINNYEFTYNSVKSGNKFGLLGNPIFLKETGKLIGINKDIERDNSEKYGDFIEPICNYFLNFIEEKSKLVKECCFNKKLKEKLQYYENVNIKYKGDIIDNKYEGIGKYILHQIYFIFNK